MRATERWDYDLFSWGRLRLFSFTTVAITSRSLNVIAVIFCIRTRRRQGGGDGDNDISCTGGDTDFSRFSSPLLDTISPSIDLIGTRLQEEPGNRQRLLSPYKRSLNVVVDGFNLPPVVLRSFSPLSSGFLFLVVMMTELTLPTKLSHPFKARYFTLNKQVEQNKTNIGKLMCK